MNQGYDSFMYQWVWLINVPMGFKILNKPLSDLQHAILDFASEGESIVKTMEDFFTFKAKRNQK